MPAHLNAKMLSSSTDDRLLTQIASETGFMLQHYAQYRMSAYRSSQSAGCMIYL
jgi:hypothetical protein